MWRKVIALGALVITGAPLATPSALPAEMRVVTSDATAELVPLEVGKFIVIHLASDAKDVLVAKPDIANVVMQTARRVVILGIATGQTDIAFYDADHEPIKALDLSVVGYPVSANLAGGPARVVTLFRGGMWLSLSCTQTSNLSEGAGCYKRENSSKTLASLPKGSSVTIPAGTK